MIKIFHFCLAIIEKKLDDKEGKFQLWYGKDSFKDIVWHIDKEEQIDKETISCSISARGGKTDPWDFSDEVVFKRVGWSWKISKLPKFRE